MIVRMDGRVVESSEGPGAPVGVVEEDSTRGRARAVCGQIARSGGHVDRGLESSRQLPHPVAAATGMPPHRPPGRRVTLPTDGAHRVGRAADSDRRVSRPADGARRPPRWPPRRPTPPHPTPPHPTPPHPIPPPPPFILPPPYLGRRRGKARLRGRRLLGRLRRLLHRLRLGRHKRLGRLDRRGRRRRVLGLEHFHTLGLGGQRAVEQLALAGPGGGLGQGGRGGRAQQEGGGQGEAGEGGAVCEGEGEGGESVWVEGSWPSDPGRRPRRGSAPAAPFSLSCLSRSWADGFSSAMRYAGRTAGSPSTGLKASKRTKVRLGPPHARRWGRNRREQRWPR